MKHDKAVEYATEHGVDVEAQLVRGAPFRVGRHRLYRLRGRMWTFKGGPVGWIGALIVAAVDAERAQRQERGE